MKKSSKAFLIVGAMAAIVITAVYVQYSPFNERDAQGAIGAVEKYRDDQIEAKDVVLGDEQQRKEEAGLYGDLLEDAIRLESMGTDLGSFAGGLGVADSASLSSFSQTLDSRAQLMAKEALELISDLQAREDLASFGGDLQAMQKGLESRANLEAKTLASFQDMVDNMARSLDAKSALEAKDLMAAKAKLESLSRELGSREASLDSRMLESMSEDLGSMAADLGARQKLESRMLESRVLAARVEQLGAKILGQRVIAASRQQLESLSSNLESKSGLESKVALESKAQLESFSADLASRSADLESRALSSMQGRLEMRMLEAKALENMEMMAASARQNLESRSDLESKALQSMSSSLGSLEKGLESRQAELGQRYLFGMQSELGAISNHLESRENLGSRALQSRQLESKQLQAKQLESRQLGMKNLESFNAYLGSLSSALENRGFVENRDRDALGARAQELQNRTSDLQSKLQM